MPSGNPPHKLNKKITNAFLRYEMIKTATRQEKYFDVSDYEINKLDISYTYETLGYFNSLEKDTDWYFLTGADCLMDIENWKNVKEIFQLCKLIVFSRPGYNVENIEKQKSRVEKRYLNKIIFLNMPLLDISSTSIRETIREGKCISYLLPESVYNIINELNLYN
jgi:nicotinate-nucleotide adenylyltransferase